LKKPAKKKVKKILTSQKKWLKDKAIAEYLVRERIGLEPADPLAEAGRKVLSIYFGQMLLHEPETRLGNDIEALHDMRVAIRRMRAAFKLVGNGFRKKKVKPLLAGLKATGSVLGQVRDLDVLMENLLRYQSSLPDGDQADFQPVVETWAAQREQARQEMLAYLDSKKYRRFKQEFLAFVTKAGRGAKPIPDAVVVPYQLRHLVPGLIFERYEAARVYELVLDEAAPETLHQLRIALKHLRYAIEFFAEILGEESKGVVEAIKALQDHLGQLNDAETACIFFRDLLAEQPDKEQLAAYLEARQAERQALLDSFPQAWARFNQPELRRDLALAVSVP
jgi:CHAD domain-containing protein